MKYSISTIVITVLAIIIILALSFLFYYYATKPAPAVSYAGHINTVVQQTPAVSQIVPTNVITFSPPNVLPTGQKSGNCFASSVAMPFRTDAWRCMVVNAIYDPCFSVNKKGFVYCQVGIDESTGFLMRLTKALPKPDIPPVMQNNWAWYVMLKDGTECSPFTGTRPFFGTGPGAQVAYYGCKSNDKNKQIDLLGDLTEGTVWTATEALLTKTGTNWTINSTQQVDINTVWQ